MRKNRQQGGERSAWRSGGKVEKTSFFDSKTSRKKTFPTCTQLSGAKNGWNGRCCPQGCLWCSSITCSRLELKPRKSFKVRWFCSQDVIEEHHWVTGISPHQRGFFNMENTIICAKPALFTLTLRLESIKGVDLGKKGQITLKTQVAVGEFPPCS